MTETSSALVTVCLEEPFEQIGAITHVLMRQYAARHGMDFIVHRRPAPTGLPPHYAKYAIGDLLDTYERVLFIDTDVLVNPSAPNLLPLVPRDDVGAYLASEHSDVHDDAIHKIQETLGDLGWNRTYFNSGVMLVSRAHRDVFDPALGAVVSFGEQTQLNYNCRRLGVAVHDITHRFNHVQTAPNPGDRASSAFVHYAGPGHREGDRLAQIAADLLDFAAPSEPWSATPPGVLERCRAVLGAARGSAGSLVRLSITRSTPETHEPRAAAAPPIRFCTEQVVMQPTSFCNIYCRYCYLPGRNDRRRMSVDTAERTFGLLAEGGALAPRVECRWHAGEPLVMPIAFYRDAIDRISDAVADGTTVWHSVQTNATLIDEAWARFFLDSGMRVGLSIDGPDHVHDRNRVRRDGRGTHADSVRGAAFLREAGVPFDVIAVVTPASIDEPDEIYAFFGDIGAASVGFNIEESEGDHISKLIGLSDLSTRYRGFLTRVHELAATGPVRVREFDEMRSAVLVGRGDRRNLMTEPMAIVTVDCDGNLTTFSPELLGMRSDAYNDFVVGNVWTDTVDGIVRSRALRTMTRDIEAGVEMCRETCEYFTLCGGGAPSNKLYENGAFRSTETAYCRSRIKIPADITIASLERAARGSGA